MVVGRYCTCGRMNKVDCWEMSGGEEDSDFEIGRARVGGAPLPLVSITVGICDTR